MTRILRVYGRFGGAGAFPALTPAKPRRYKQLMISRFFTWLENYVDSFPQAGADKPKPTLLAFAYHYTRPFLPLLIASIALLHGHRLHRGLSLRLHWQPGGPAGHGRSRHLLGNQRHSSCAFMGALVLLVLPILNFISEAISHQGLRGNFAMRIRWLAHRYVLRQSMDFFHNDFAGRVATKVMQAALGVRDAVMKITEVVVYVSVYFIGALILVATSDLWLMVPLLVWLGGYALCLLVLRAAARQALGSPGRHALAGGGPRG